MNKFTMKYLLITLFIWVTQLTLHSQQNIIWKANNVSFTLPNIYSPVVNDEEEFTALGNGTSININQYNNEVVEGYDINEYVQFVLDANSFEGAAKFIPLELNGLKAAYSEFRSEDEQVFILCALDDKRKSNFYVLLHYLYGEKIKKEDALKIFKSFKQD
jgi:hypothetical protein